MNLREAAEAALKAMVSFESGTNGLYEGEFAEEIAALKAALAEPVQEPVAWVSKEKSLLSWDKFYPDMTPLYTAPPQRKSLTEEEIHDCWQQRHRDKATERRLITRAIERAHGIGGNDESA